jgi:hypothetical protein
LASHKTRRKQLRRLPGGFVAYPFAAFEQDPRRGFRFGLVPLPDDAAAQPRRGGGVHVCRKDWCRPPSPERGRRETARALKEMGAPVEMIAKSTKLSPEVIAAL